MWIVDRELEPLVISSLCHMAWRLAAYSFLQDPESVLFLISFHGLPGTSDINCYSHMALLGTRWQNTSFKPEINFHPKLAVTREMDQPTDRQTGI